MNEVRKLFQESLNIDFLGATLSNPKNKDDVKKINELAKEATEDNLSKICEISNDILEEL